MNQAGQLLAGVRIVDLSMNLSGPYGSMLLADIGAEVIKVEPPAGDPQRTLIPFVGGVSVLFASINRNKRSVTIDLRKPEGRALLLKLVARSDALYNNYRPGVLDRLGLSFDELKQANPRIVVVSLSGYGQTGPKKDWPAYDVAIQALSGGMSLTGHPGQAPARAGIPLADLSGGMFAAMAVLAGLRARRAERGGHVRHLPARGTRLVAHVLGRDRAEFREPAGATGRRQHQRDAVRRVPLPGRLRGHRDLGRGLLAEAVPCARTSRPCRGPALHHEHPSRRASRGAAVVAGRDHDHAVEGRVDRDPPRQRHPERSDQQRARGDGRPSGDRPEHAHRTRRGWRAPGVRREPAQDAPRATSPTRATAAAWGAHQEVAAELGLSSEEIGRLVDAGVIRGPGTPKERPAS